MGSGIQEIERFELIERLCNGRSAVRVRGIFAPPFELPARFEAKSALFEFFLNPENLDIKEDFIDSAVFRIAFFEKVYAAEEDWVFDIDGSIRTAGSPELEYISFNEKASFKADTSRSMGFCFRNNLDDADPVGLEDKRELLDSALQALSRIPLIDVPSGRTRG